MKTYNITTVHHDFTKHSINISSLVTYCTASLLVEPLAGLEWEPHSLARHAWYTDESTHSQSALLTPPRDVQLLHCGLCRQRVRSQVWQSGRAISTSISVSLAPCRPPCPPLSIWGLQRYSLARLAPCPQAGYCSSAHGKHARSACMPVPHDILVFMQPCALG